ncbi:hypothetical protein [Aliirhizobium terrae]|uniref:hypothetical protein n=1 Tax=Terrirhizobium terrae TaxID=2926709 RepID=UPI0040438B2B
MVIAARADLDLRIRLVERDLIVARFDLRDHGARVEMLVVGSRNIGEVAGNLGRHREAASVDESVVRRLIRVEEDQPDKIGSDAERDQQRDDQCDPERMTLEYRRLLLVVFSVGLSTNLFGVVFLGLCAFGLIRMGALSLSHDMPLKICWGRDETPDRRLRFQ